MKIKKTLKNGGKAVWKAIKTTLTNEKGIAPAIGAALISAGAGIAGSVIDWVTGKGQIQEQNKANKNLAKETWELNKKQWELENEYNTPANQMKRFEEAGLNPNLIYGQTNLSANSPAYVSPEAQAAGGTELGKSGIANRAIEAYRNTLEAKNAEADYLLKQYGQNKTLEEIKAIELARQLDKEKNIREARAAAQALRNAQAQERNTNANTEKTKADAENSKKGDTYEKRTLKILDNTLENAEKEGQKAKDKYPEHHKDKGVKNPIPKKYRAKENEYKESGGIYY